MKHTGTDFFFQFTLLFAQKHDINRFLINSYLLQEYTILIRIGLLKRYRQPKSVRFCILFKLNTMNFPQKVTVPLLHWLTKCILICVFCAGIQLGVHVF